MAISTLVLALTGGGSAPVPSPAPKPSDKGGVKEWIKKHLQALGRALANLAGKAAAALPRIIGSIVPWLLSVMFIESLFLYWRNVARLLFVNPRNVCLSNVTSLFVMDVVMCVLYMLGVGHD